MVYSLFKGKFHGVLSLQGVDEEIYKKEYLLQKYVGKTFLSTVFYKWSCMFFEDFIEVPDTHTNVYTNS